MEYRGGEVVALDAPTVAFAVDEVHEGIELDPA
jgi:hypothetical protein